MLSLVDLSSSSPQSIDASISRSEIISALSFALDLTQGAVSGHALRTCLLGMRIAECVPVPTKQRSSLYYGLLLKDVGRSRNATTMCRFSARGHSAAKTAVDVQNSARLYPPPTSPLRLLWNSVLQKIALTHPTYSQKIIKPRDHRASIVRKLGMSWSTAETLLFLHERWDGSGYPERRRKHDIPLLARIAAVGQHLDLFATKYGSEMAVNVLRERRGCWFDPQLADIAASLHADGSLWIGANHGVQVEETLRRVLAIAPDGKRDLAPFEINTICEAFAEVVDTKSVFTSRHSLGVANAADAIAKQMCLPQARRQLLARASLLHDIGKLSVSNSILDKSGALTVEEWKVLKQHPVLTRQILGRVSAFEELARIAG